MIVQKCEVVKIEAIVRGYITGQFPSPPNLRRYTDEQDPDGLNTKRAEQSTVSPCRLV
jgi:phosphoribosylaminoimidazole-succinocarboxamide synthase